MSKERWISINAIVTPEQKKQISDRAEKSNMSINEYIKSILFDNEKVYNDLSKLGTYEKKLISLVTRSYFVMQKFIKNSDGLSESEIAKASTMSYKKLLDEGFLNKDDIPENINID